MDVKERQNNGLNYLRMFNCTLLSRLNLLWWNHYPKRHGKKEKEMKLQIEIVKENKDGSADALVHFDKEALGMLIEKGVISILRQYIKQEKKAKKEKK